MSQVLALTTAAPAHLYTLNDALAALQVWLRDSPAQYEEARKIFENAAVERRFSALPISALIEERSLEESNAIYLEAASNLAERVARDALLQAGVRADEIDAVFVTSCTGYALPGLDALLAHRLECRSDVKRLPFLQFGCAGGVRSLAAAHDFLLAYPKGVALVVSVELTSLTFQVHDRSQKNIVAAALFGDGAAAALLCGSARGERGVMQISGSESFLFPNSQNLMGFELTQRGFQLVLDRAITRVIAESGREQLWRMLKSRELLAPDFAAIHPGGPAVLQVLAERCEMSPALLEPSWKVFRQFGNMSGATVLYILKNLIEAGANGRGVALAFGPGFAMELLELTA